MTLINAALGLGRLQFYSRDILQNNPPNTATHMCQSSLDSVYPLHFLLCADTKSSVCKDNSNSCSTLYA